MENYFNLSSISELIAEEFGIELANKFITEYLSLEEENIDENGQINLFDKQENGYPLEKFFIEFIEEYFIQPVNHYNYARQSFHESIFKSQENYVAEMVFDGVDAYKEVELGETLKLIRLFKEVNRIG